MLCSSSADGLVADGFTRANLVCGRKAKLKVEEGNVKGKLSEVSLTTGNPDLQVCHGFRGSRVLDRIGGGFDQDFFLGCSAVVGVGGWGLLG